MSHSRNNVLHLREARASGEDGKLAKAKRTSVAADDAFYYKRYPHKALTGLRPLTMEQRGFYATLIDLIYDQRGPLADDDVANARLFGIDLRLFRRLQAELLELERIKIKDGTLFVERAIRELVRMDLYSETQARRAKTKWKKRSRPKAKPDFGPTIPVTVAATVAATLGQNVDRTPNEINGPKHAEENRKEQSSNSSSNLGTGSAERTAQPPGGGGALTAQKLDTPSETEREAFLANQRAKLGVEPGTTK